MKTKTAARAVITCVSITERVIKFVQSKAGDITALEAVPFTHKSDEEIGRALEGVFKGKTQKELGRCILLIPRQLAALHYVRLPSTKPDEIREMARLQACKQLPYEPQAIILGCQVIRVTPEGYSDVLLIIVHQDIIKKYLKFLERNKVEPQEITLDSQGILRWYKLQKGYDPRACALIIDFDSGYARLDIIVSGIAVYSRAFSLIGTVNEFKQKLVDEINKSLVAYDKENIGIKPESIVFTGAQELVDAIDDSVTANLPFRCIKLTQGQEIALKAHAAIRNHDFEKNSFTSLLGIALSKEELPFNLLPEDTLLKRQRVAYTQQIHKAIVFSCLVIAGVSIGMFFNISERRKVIQGLNAQARSLSGDVDRIEMMSKQLNYVKSQLLQSTVCLDALTEIFRIAPADITLASFGYDVDKPIVLKGQAKTLSGVFNFVNTLEASAMFKEVQVRYSSKRKVKDGEIADFEIVCPIEEK